MQFVSISCHFSFRVTLFSCQRVCVRPRGVKDQVLPSPKSMGINHKNTRGEVRLLVYCGLAALNSSLRMSLSGHLPCVKSLRFHVSLFSVRAPYQMHVLIRQQPDVDSVYTGMSCAHLWAKMHSPDNVEM